MSDLQYSVGVDATDLNTGVEAVDRRLEKTGQRFAEMPRKYQAAVRAAFEDSKNAEGEWEALKAQHAQADEQRLRKRAADSAAVFEAEMAREEKLAAEKAAAEGKLSAYREQTAFKRMSDEEKLAVLRTRAHGLLEQIGMTEEGSAKRAELQLQFEEKKSEIFELNKKISAESLVVQQAQGAEVESQGKKYSGIGGHLEQLKKGFKDLGVSIQGAGIGIFLGALIGFGRQAIADAQKMRDDYDRMRKPLDNATRSLANLGDAQDQLVEKVKKGFAYWLSGYTQLGELTGFYINRARGIGEAEQNIVAQQERQIALNEKRNQQYQAEQYNVEKIDAAWKSLEQESRKARFDRATEEEKFNLIFMQGVKLREQLRQTEVGTLNHVERQRALLENSLALHAQSLLLVKQRAETELQDIKERGSLDITYQEKSRTLASERLVLTRELREVDKGSADYKEIGNKLDANSLELIKLQREWRKSTALEQSAQLDLVKLELKGVANLTDAERARYELLKLQRQEKQLQFQIDELLEKRLVAGLNPEEEKRLKTLLKQDEKLEKQIATKEKLIAASVVQTTTDGENVLKAEDLYRALLKQGLARDDIIKQLQKQGFTNDEIGGAEARIADAIERQVGKLQANGMSREQIIAQLRTELYTEEQILAVLDRKNKKAEEYVAIAIKRGRADKDLSDRELAEKIGNLRTQLSEVEAEMAKGDRYIGFMQPQLANDLRLAEFERNRRASFRRDYGQRGDAALDNYSAFDEQTLRNYIRPEDEKRAAQTAKHIEEINLKLGRILPK